MPHYRGGLYPHISNGLVKQLRNVSKQDIYFEWYIRLTPRPKRGPRVVVRGAAAEKENPYFVVGDCLT